MYDSMPCRLPSSARCAALVAAVAASVSGFAATAVTVAVNPSRAAVTASQSQQFGAQVTGDPQNLGVVWSVDGTPGGTAAAGTIGSTGWFTPGSQFGVHTVTATSVADGTQSASATVAVTDLAGVFTHHNDAQRTGSNAKEYDLTPATVSANFGELFSCALDAPGYVYAQPLYVAGLTMGDGRKHNVLFLATESDWVYAYNADASSCQRFWRTRVLQPGETTVPNSDTNAAFDLVPEIGVTSTPVIDPATNTLYVVAKSKDASANYHHRLWALDLVAGTPKLGSPTEIAATNFVPLYQLQRTALLLSGGTVYFGFGSHGDQNSWQGWLMAYDATSLAQKFAWSSTDPTTTGVHGGIWSMPGPSGDASGNVYVTTGNGTFDVNTGGDNYGDSVVKLSPSASVASYFTPNNQATLEANDLDLGSAGVIVLPDSLGSAAHPHLALASGKPGLFYLLDRDNLGQYNNPDQAVQEVAVDPNTTDPEAGMYGVSALWNGNLYVGPVANPLYRYTIANGAISTTAQSQSANSFTYRGTTPAVSANGTTNGVVWALDNTNVYPFFTPAPAVLYAYDATNLANQLYASPASGAGAAGLAVKFTVPTVANGRVYVGGQGVVTVFGDLPEPNGTLGLAFAVGLLAALHRTRLRSR